MKRLLTIMFATTFAVAPIMASAKQERSEAAKDAFKREHPCPANHNNHGSCPGYVIDHIKPLACGGVDDPSNMQWQTVAEGKAKDKWERKGCEIKRDNAFHSPLKKRGVTKGTGAGVCQTARSSGIGCNRYHLGPKGGCYTITSNGKKRHVDRSYCNRY